MSEPMQNIPAATGWAWFKGGFALFRRQPAELSTLFLSYLFMMVAVGLVPVAGQLLPLLLVPAFSMAFLQACVKVEKGERVYPNLLMTGFRSPARNKLLVLGLLYLLALVAAIYASTLLDSKGVFLRLLTVPGGVAPAEVAAGGWAGGMLLSALVYLPAGMCFWFAAPLVAWQDMSVGKAIFYSFFAVVRARKAFLVYGVAWLLTGVLLPSILSTILAMVLGRSLISLLILMPVSLILTAILYYSFYPTYVTIFGAPGQTLAADTNADPAQPGANPDS
jgi:hypothetical protein